MGILKKSILCFVLNITPCLLLTDNLLAWSAGPPAYRTNAPGDKGTCDADGCHSSYSLDSGSAKFSITAPATYTAGKSVKIQVSFSSSKGKFHGFQMTALDANGNRVGTFKKIGNTTQIIPLDNYRELKQADKNRYIEHTYNGIKKKQWVFNWVAPASATDPITFYAAGCEADGDSTAAKDYVYTTTAEIHAGSPKP